MATQYGEGGSISVMMEGPFGGGGSSVKLAEVVLPVSEWKGAESPYSQAVTVDGISQNSMVNLQLSVEQLAQFHNKDITFTAVNENGTVTVYAIGDKPDGDYTIQATLFEVIGNSATIIGSTVGTTMLRADWSQTDESKADFIRNKPTELINNALQKTGGTMTGNIAMSGKLVKGLGEPTDDGDATNKKYLEDYVKKSRSEITVMLPADGWADKVQTVNADGVTADNTVLATPSPGSYEACLNAGVYCSGQGSGTLSFACVKMPSSDVSFNVLIFQ